jgi:histone chaperone ASF1
MSIVNITNVAVLNNPAPLLTPFSFEITFECMTQLKEGITHFISSNSF